MSSSLLSELLSTYCDMDRLLGSPGAVVLRTLPSSCWWLVGISAAIAAIALSLRIGERREGGDGDAALSDAGTHERT